MNASEALKIYLNAESGIFMPATNNRKQVMVSKLIESLKEIPEELDIACRTLLAHVDYNGQPTVINYKSYDAEINKYVEKQLKVESLAVVDGHNVIRHTSASGNPYLSVDKYSNELSPKQKESADFYSKYL